MEKVGVELIVQGLDLFLDSMSKADKSVKSFGDSSSFLGKIFEGLGNIFEGLISGVFRVLEYTIGQLLADAVRALIAQIRELIVSTIEAGQEFQTLELRLQNLNLNAAINSGKSYTEAQQEAVEVTKEQLTWLQKLAATTPYDAQDIANVYTLARSYSFADKESRTLTESITNFAAGMGLGNVEIQRIIENFGQMVQQGKVTKREMNDLARGAFVPVNDVLDIMQEKTGLSDKAFEKFRNTAEGVNLFMESFVELVDQRFSKSATAMARTFKGATDNVKDFVKSIVGMNIVKPILDVIGGKIADVMDALVQEDRWNAITDAASRIGEVLSEIVTQILGLSGDAGSIADQVVEGFEKIASWLDEHKQDIIDWVNNAIEKLKEFRDWLFGTPETTTTKKQGGKYEPGFEPTPTVTPGTTGAIQPVLDALNSLLTWISTNKQTILDFFSALGDIILDVFGHFTAPLEGVEGGGIGDAIVSFMQFVIDNKERIADFIVILTVLKVVFSVIAVIVGFLVSLFFSLIGIMMTVAGIAFTLGSSLGAVVAAIATLVSGVIIGIAIFLSLIGIVLQLIVAFIMLKSGFEPLKAAWQAMVERFRVLMQQLLTLAISTVVKVVDAFRKKDWKGLGESIVKGIIMGIVMMAQALVEAAVSAVTAAYDAAKSALESESPSKLFARLGESTMEGFAKGIVDSTRMAAKAMQNAVNRVALPAYGIPASAYQMAMNPGSTTNNTVNNNLSMEVHTPTRSENIIADFQMMKSLASG